MYPIKRRGGLSALLATLAGLAVWSAPATAQDEARSRWWLGADLGGAAVNSQSPAPSANRNAVAASVDFGYRLTPQWGLGFEFGAVAPVEGCKDWACAGTAASFAPNFTRLQAFSEFRPRCFALLLQQALVRFCLGVGRHPRCHPLGDAGQ
jgi:hypothetical protein